MAIDAVDGIAAFDADSDAILSQAQRLEHLWGASAPESSLHEELTESLHGFSMDVQPLLHQISLTQKAQNPHDTIAMQAKRDELEAIYREIRTQVLEPRIERAGDAPPMHLADLTPAMTMQLASLMPTQELSEQAKALLEGMATGFRAADEFNPQGTTQNVLGYNMCSYVVDCQLKLDERNDQQMDALLDRMRASNKTLSELQAHLTRIYQARASGEEFPIEEFKERCMQLQNCLDTIAEDFPEIRDFVDLDALIESGEVNDEILGKLSHAAETLKLHVQNEQPMIMNDLKKTAELFITIVEILKNIAKNQDESTRLINRRSAAGG